MTAPILAIVGIIIGASLQYFFTRYLEDQRHYRALKTEAFKDYIKCVSELAHLDDRSRISDIRARMADAKARICLYGSYEVIKKFALFEQHGGLLTTGQQRRAFVEVAFAMRTDLGGKGNPEFEDLELILLGERPDVRVPG